MPQRTRYEFIQLKIYIFIYFLPRGMRLRILSKLSSTHSPAIINPLTIVSMQKLCSELKRPIRRHYRFALSRCAVGNQNIIPAERIIVARSPLLVIS